MKKIWNNGPIQSGLIQVEEHYLELLANALNILKPNKQFNQLK